LFATALLNGKDRTSPEEKSMMKNTSRSNTGILIAGSAVIVLAVLLFANAISIADFASPGQGLFQGRSFARIALAFLLVTGLACALLVALFRAGRSREAASVAKAAATRAEAPEKAVAGKAEASVGIISDTAGVLRTTVDVIQEELEEILDDEAPADKEHMQALHEETDRLKKIIDSMEQFSRVPALARPERKETLQIEPLLASIIEATRLAVTGKNMTYTLECEAGLAMQANPECIGLIIGNITDNAARSIKGAGSVALSAGRRDDRVVFSVKDSGTGIRRAHLAHIYERFFRGAGSGVGMGLAIAKELVDACGGTIEVQTAVNKGTTFIVQLPAERTP